MQDKIKKWWTNYKQKKSVWAKISDIVFLALIIGLIFPASRMFIVSNIQRITMMQPDVETENLPRLSQADYNWELYNMQGELVKFAEFEGKVVFINFWATWCPPCVAEMPSIQKFYDTYKDNPDVAILLVTNENAQKVETFNQKRGFTFPFYMTKSAAPKILYSKSIPATFIVDKQGRVVVSEYRATKWHGRKTHTLMENLLNE